ncbi:DUF6489 family protein [Geminicoccaceae bacterium 1502E]|nr:DUF6489 family protein [Geminicoccaceae bacterium 1502E]
MKFLIEVDCSPEEARQFIGLPEVAPMQKAVMETIEKRLVETIGSVDSKTLLDNWMPLSLKGMEQWQSMWNQLATAAAGMQGKPRSEKKG